MRYQNVVEGRFQSRPNRFLAHVELGGSQVVCHVKNTGRCRELLLPDVPVFLEHHPGREDRKTAYSLIGVRKGDRIVNLDSQAPNRVLLEALEQGRIQLPGLEQLTVIRPESTFASSRFDFYLEGHAAPDEPSSLKKAFLEVKGVTLEEEGVARFPDAPTQRGVRHIQELVEAARAGYLGYIVFVIQMERIHRLEPNDATHPAFGEALRHAREQGVKILAYLCKTKEDELLLTDQTCPVKL